MRGSMGSFGRSSRSGKTGTGEPSESDRRLVSRLTGIPEQEPPRVEVDRDKGSHCDSCGCTLEPKVRLEYYGTQDGEHGPELVLFVVYGVDFCTACRERFRRYGSTCSTRLTRGC